jgi:myo-inositol-1-phosphate synthase
LFDLLSDQSQAVFGQSEDIHANVKLAERAALGDYTPRNEIQTLEILEHAHERGGVSFGNDPKLQQGEVWR